MMPDQFCPHCQLSYEPRARFCAVCGRPLEQPLANVVAPPVNAGAPPVPARKTSHRTVWISLAWLAASAVVLCVLGLGCATVSSYAISFLRKQADPVSLAGPAEASRPTLTPGSLDAHLPPTVQPEPAGAEPTASSPGEPTEPPEPPASSATPRPAGRPFVGALAPEFTLLDALSGEPVTLSHFTGQPVVVHFWATWCGYCEEEFVYLREAFETHRTAGLVILAIDYEDQRDDVVEYGQAHDLAFPLLLDKNGAVTDDDYRVDGFPTSFFIFPDGTISFIQIGTMTSAELDTQLSRIMAP